MRNLKRALSLALASVMLMGMMVVGTSAASYPDVDVADNLEAIEVLKAVGIMTGDEKGNFNPDNLVTRNEMAVVMVNLLGLKTGGTHPFTDVPTWANDYVAACYNNGIIAGTSATTFGGGADVTAVQAGLMVMKALGYFGYQGEFADDWKVATVKQANKIDLYDGINAYTDQSMSRNEVAQMVLNALECTIQVVTQEGGLSVDGNGITVVQNPTYKYADAENRSGRDYASKGDTSTMELCEKIFGTDLKKNTDTTDDFGRPASSWTYGTTTITTPKAADLTYTKGVKGKAIYEDLGKVSSVTYQDAAGNASRITVDGQDNQSVASFGITSGNNIEIGGKGTLTEVFFDKDTKKATIIQINTYLAQATSDYDKDDDELDITVKATGSFTSTLDGEDFAIANYREDDYLLVTAITSDGSSYTVKSVAAPTIIEDVKVSAYKTDDYVTADGTKYEYNKVAMGDTSALGQDLMDGSSNYSLNDKTYNIYLDSHGYAIGVKGYSSSANLDDYVFVTEAAKSGFEYIAKAVFMDGTTKNIVVTKTAQSGGTLTKVDDVEKPDSDLTTNRGLSADGKLEAGLFYTYSVNKNNEYQLTEVAAAKNLLAKGKTISGDKVKPVEDDTTNIATANTVFIADGKVYTGVKNGPKVAASNVYYLLDGSRILAVYTAESGKTSTDAAELVYILNSAYGTAKDADDNTYYIYDAIVDGKKTTLNASNSGKTVGLYEIDSYTDGYADLGSPITSTANEYVYGTSATAYEFKESVLSVTGGAAAGSYFLTDGVEIYTVNGTTVKTGVSPNSLGAKTITDGFTTIILVQKSTTNSDIVAIYLVKP